jgi:hypothetical protein
MRFLATISVFIVVLTCPIVAHGDPASDALRSRLQHISRISTTEPASGDFSIMYGTIKKPYSIVAFVQHKGSDNYVLMCDGAGRPKAFSKNSFFALADSLHPGHLEIRENARVDLNVEGGVKTRVSLKCDLTGKNLDFGCFSWDPASLALSALGSAVEMRHDPAGGDYLIQTKDFRFVIDMSMLPKNEVESISVREWATAHDAAIFFSRTIPVDCDLSKVDILGLKKLPGAVYGGDPGFILSDLKSETAQLATSNQLAALVPANACFAKWFVATRLRRLRIAQEIAADCVGPDVKQKLVISTVFDKAAGRLTELAARLAKGSIQVDQAEDELKAKEDPILTFGAAVPHPRYLEFAIRYSAVPSLFAVVEEDRVFQVAILGVVGGLPQSDPVDIATSSCINNLIDTEVLEDDDFAERISADAFEKQLDEGLKEQYQSLAKLLTAQQFAQVAAAYKTADDEYKARVKGDGK